MGLRSLDEEEEEEKARCVVGAAWADVHGFNDVTDVPAVTDVEQPSTCAHRSSCTILEYR